MHDSNGKGEITLHSIEAETFSVLLHYAYTGIVNVTRDNVQSVLIAADYFSISSVKKECEKFIASNLDCDNVCDAAQFAISYSLPILKQQTLQFLKERLPEVSSTSGFRDLDPRFLVSFLEDDGLVLQVNGMRLKSVEREKLIMGTVLQYLSDRGESDPQVLSMVFQTVRLIVIPKDDIRKCLENFKGLKKTEGIKKYLDLHEVAVEFFKQRGQDSSLTTPIGGAGIENVPDAWFRRRKLANYEIRPGKMRYAAGGQVAVARGYPSYLYNDPELEIERVEVWIRRWYGRPVIGGLAVTYRANPTFDLKGNPDKSKLQRYCKGRCQSPNDRDYFCATFEPGEYVVKVNVSSGHLIDRLCFRTNTGRTLGPFGGRGGGKHTQVAPSGATAYLYDINCDETNTQGSPAIYNLMFRWITLE
ncbi:kelch-like protein 40 [Elysia marginata]|uniref:Kelch-like protein 40 n=1 Tax=Elysia marginata TaxID=1093978 RepID=A0AAV4JI23_9GAST|nr:kelch-like protein 40 [Elysia marginata]